MAAAGGQEADQDIVVDAVYQEITHFVAIYTVKHQHTEWALRGGRCVALKV